MQPVAALTRASSTVTDTPPEIVLIRAHSELPIVPLSMKITSPAVRFVVLATVIAVAPAATVPDTASVASSDVLYKVKASGRPDIPVTGWMKPDKGRPVKDTEGIEIWPRKVGSRCWLVRRVGEGPNMETVAELEVPTEKIAFGGCPPPAVQAPAPVLPSMFDLEALPAGGE